MRHIYLFLWDTIITYYVIVYEIFCEYEVICWFDYM